MTNFISVSTSAARFQDISLNPQKLAGQCAKLKCCLNYEVDAYVECQKRLPSKEITLETADATYFYFKADILKGTITYSTDKSFLANEATITARRAFEIINMNKRGEKPEKLIEEYNERESKQSKDLLEQESLTRFDKSRNGKGKKKKQKNNVSANGETTGLPASANGQDNANNQKGQPENRSSRTKNRASRSAQQPQQANKPNAAEGNRGERPSQEKREGNERPPRQGRNNRNNNRRNNGNKPSNPNEQNEAKKHLNMKLNPFQILRHNLQFILPTVFLFLWASCRQDTRYHTYQPIPTPDGWHKQDTLSFQLPEQIEGEGYRLEVGIRNTNQYPFRDIWLSIRQNWEDSLVFQTDTLHFYLADEQGKWNSGGNTGSLFQHTYFCEKTFTIRSSSVNVLQMTHLMKKIRFPESTTPEFG